MNGKEPFRYLTNGYMNTIIASKLVMNAVTLLLNA
jgi:hypothetical protein